jgi:hypothetical protein
MKKSPLYAMRWDKNVLLYRDNPSGYEVVQDEKYPSMYRVRFPDGTLTEMANLTRAHEAARAGLETSMRKARKDRVNLRGGFP